MVRVSASRSCWTSVTGMGAVLLSVGRVGSVVVLLVLLLVLLPLLGEQLVHPRDAAAPEGLEVREHRAHRPHGLHVAAGEGLATLPTLGQQARALEHRDVLLDGGEAHVV